MPSLNNFIKSFSSQGFLTDSGDVNLDRVQLILSDLGDVEDEIFKKRQQNELAFKQREKNKKRRMEAISNYKPSWTPVGQFAPTVIIYLFFLNLFFFFVSKIWPTFYREPQTCFCLFPTQPVGQSSKPVQNARQEAYKMRMQGRDYNTNAIDQAMKGTSANKALESMIEPEVSYSTNNYIYLFIPQLEKCHNFSTNRILRLDQLNIFSIDKKATGKFSFLATFICVEEK